MNLAKDVENNGKDYKLVIRNRSTKQNVAMLLNKMGVLVTEDAENAVTELCSSLYY